MASYIFSLQVNQIDNSDYGLFASYVILVIAPLIFDNDIIIDQFNVLKIYILFGQMLNFNVALFYVEDFSKQTYYKLRESR